VLRVEAFAGLGVNRNHNEQLINVMAAAAIQNQTRRASCTRQLLSRSRYV
jgi:hypothetical protein